MNKPPNHTGSEAYRQWAIITNNVPMLINPECRSTRNEKRECEDAPTDASCTYQHMHTASRLHMACHQLRHRCVNMHTCQMTRAHPRIPCRSSIHATHQQWSTHVIFLRCCQKQKPRRAYALPKQHLVNLNTISHKCQHIHRIYKILGHLTVPWTVPHVECRA